MTTNTILLQKLVEHASEKEGSELQGILENLGIEVPSEALEEKGTKKYNKEEETYEDEDGVLRYKDSGDPVPEEEAKKYMKEGVSEEERQEAIETILEKLDESSASDFKQMVEAQGYSADFLTKAEALFESTLNARKRVMEKGLEEKYENYADKYINEHIVPQIDDYVTYVAEQYIENNRENVQANLKGELAENFIHGLKELFESNYVDVPESKVDVVEEKEERITELNSKLNEALTTNKELHKKVDLMERKDVINEVSRDLSVNESAKLEELAEDLSFQDRDNFKAKLESLKESHFAGNDGSGDLDNGHGTGRHEDPQNLEESKKHGEGDSEVDKINEWITSRFGAKA